MTERTDAERRTDDGSIARVAVSGAGSVGHGIAEVSAVVGVSAVAGVSAIAEKSDAGDLGAKTGQGFGLRTTTDDVIEGVEAFRGDCDPDFGGE